MLMMWYLLYCRRTNRENTHAEDKLYDAMCVANLLGALAETVSFLVDGMTFPGAFQINYLANSLAFLGTVTIGFLWSLYADLRIFRNYKRSSRRTRVLCIPWVIEVVAILANLAGTGILFTISAGNVYQRASGAILGYISLMIYFAYSVVLVLKSKKDGSNLHFFPIQYFVGPCLAGVLLQYFFYGITVSWVSVAVALVFVQMQTYAENIYRDELSGLFNRRFLNRMLDKLAATSAGDLFGIMLDINDFKAINDNFGHNVGDRAICAVGDALFRSIPAGAKAIRYAGDEFIVLLPRANEEQVIEAMADIRQALSQVNESKTELFCLDASMGYARFGKGDDAQAFLHRMDEMMYEEKRAFHQDQQKSA